MRFFLITPLFFSILFSIVAITKIKAQGTIDTTSHFIVDSLTGTSTDWSVYIGWSDTIDNGMEFVMDTIDEREFLRFKRIHPSSLRIDSGRVSFTDSSFRIRTDIGIRTFTTLIQDNTPWAEYNGWMKDLQLHVITSIDGKNEIGTLMLIDNKSGKTFYLESGWDSPCAPPVLSPSRKKLITFANTNYESDQSLVLIHRIRRKGKHYKLELIHSETISGRLIEDVVWMDDSRFAIAFSEVRDLEDSNRVLEENYYVKASLVRKVAQPTE